MASTITLQPVRWNDGTWHLADEALAATLCGRTPPADAETDPDAEVECSTCVKAADRTGAPQPGGSEGTHVQTFGDVPEILDSAFDESTPEDPDPSVRHEHGALVGYVVVQTEGDDARVVGLAGPDVDYAQVHRFSRTFRSASTGSKLWRVYGCGHRA